MGINEIFLRCLVLSDVHGVLHLTPPFWKEEVPQLFNAKEISMDRSSASNRDEQEGTFDTIVTLFPPCPPRKKTIRTTYLFWKMRVSTGSTTQELCQTQNDLNNDRHSHQVYETHLVPFSQNLLVSDRRKPERTRLQPH